MKKWKEIKGKRFSEEKCQEIRERAQNEVLNFKIAELRQAAGITQVELAERMETQQPALSSLENGDDLLISTLYRYVKALGGEVEVTAILDGKRIPLA